MEDVQRQLQALDQPRDTAELQALVQLVRQEGPLEKQCAEARSRRHSAEQQANKEKSSLPLWSGTLEELEALAVPPTETIDRHEREQESHNTRITSLREQAREAEAQAVALASQIDELRAEGDVPSEDELIAARGRRDAGWRLVRQAWEQGKTDATEESAFRAAVGADRDLATAYERAVERADHLADRLRREAQRVTLSARLQTELEIKTDQRDNVDKQLKEAEALAARLSDQWVAIWRPLGFIPWSAKEMRSWQRQQQALAGRSRSLREQQQQIDEVQAQIDGYCAALRNTVGDCTQLVGPSLSLMLARSEKIIEDADKLRRHREELKRSLEGLRADLRDAEVEQREAADHLAQWRERWLAAMTRLGLSCEATPAEANVFLAQIAKVLTKIHEADGNRRRIEGIDRDADRFTELARELAGRVCPDLTGFPAEAICEQLKERLKQGRSAAEKRNESRALRGREEERLRRAEESLHSAKVRLEVLCREAGCANEQELPAAEQRSRHRRQLETELRQLDEHLSELSGGQTLPEFLAAAEQVDPDTLDDELTRQEERVKQLDKEIEQRIRTIVSEQKELDRMQSTEGGAIDALERESQVAQLQTDIRHYAVLRLASRILQLSVERYRKKNESSVIARASKLFGQFTCGSFAGLQVELDDEDKPTLLGVRAGAKETVAREGLSDGTRDQLYLALRLASLQAYLESHEPLPFIVDDILLNFDNERAVAALEVLAELGRQTQVIFFTHHDHLVKLAEARLDKQLLTVHRLPDGLR
jgi:uncharacterized protein YhaN